MQPNQAIRILAALALGGLLIGCSKREPILEGARSGVRDDLGFASVAEQREAEAPREVAISLPGATANAAWTHRNGNAAHRLAHVALSPLTGQVFAANIGQASNRGHRITADPIVADGRIFTLDSRALVSATATSGASLWQTDLTPAGERSDDASGGGLATEGGRVYATTGFGELSALDAASGAILWRQSLDAGIGGAPTVAGGMVYAMARDGTAWAIRAVDGRVMWQLQGLGAAAGVAGVSAPAVADNLVIFPFPSGELLAVDAASGTRAWASQVAGRRPGRAFASVADISGDPVIAGSTVFAGSSGGRLAAVDVKTGQRAWLASEGAMSPPWVTGDTIFAISDEMRLLRLDAATGATVWAVNLPYFTKERMARQKAITAAFGPILAGGRLYVAFSDEKLRAYDPASGGLLAEYDLPGGAASAPVVAAGTLYVVSAKGQLLAFR